MKEKGMMNAAMDDMMDDIIDSHNLSDEAEGIYAEATGMDF